MATATVIADLLAARDALAAALVTFSAEVGPDVSVAGRTVSRTAYLKSLREEIGEINKLLMQLQPYSQVSQVL